MSFIPINKPIIGEEEKKAVLEVLESGFLTDASYDGGKKVREFEAKLRSLLRVKHVLAVNSGTSALLTSLLALGITRGDEVIIPSFTFVATANVVLACGAKPVFVDTKADYNIDPAQMRKAITKRTKAVIPVHLYGYPADMDEIREIADKHSVAVIEDAAESLGAEYKGAQTGALSDLGCFSLYATKVVTSGEGGAISTNDDRLADKVKQVRNHGMVHGYDSRSLGYNFRMPEIQAAIASVQMDRLSGFLSARRRNAEYLTDRISSLEGVKLTQASSDRTHVWYLYTLYLKKKRNEILERLNSVGIGAAVYFRTPVHKTPLYKGLGYSKKSLPATESASAHVISLPVHPAVSTADLHRVGDEFLKAVRALA
jgi:dTDP-4-amino-4,6-dideoxygalactose transaminase